MSLFTALQERPYNPTVVGLDPNLSLMPPELLETARKEYGTGLAGAAEAVYAFNCGILDAVCDIVPAVKPQSAYYEALGTHGIRALERTIRYAKKLGLYVILDAKRGDIGPTADAYADAYLGAPKGFRRPFCPDALTVNAYLGLDGVAPFLSRCTDGRMIFVLVKTSNPSSGELQDLPAPDAPLYEKMALLTREWAKELPLEHGYHALGIVAGATYPQELIRLRALLPNTWFLVPGYGAQGGGAEAVAHAFDPEGLGAVVNSSRGILYAYRKTGENYQDAARNAAIAMREDLCTALHRG